MKNKFTLAICQMKVVDNKAENIRKAVEMVTDAAKNKAEIVVLPEMFNCPYQNSKFREYSEKEQEGETIQKLSDAAKELGIYLFAGSIPEEDHRKLFNTCYVFGRKGEMIGKHRKMHLFDIDIKGKINFKESEILNAGDSITIVETDFCKIGVAICYDMRFPEMLRLMALGDAKIIIVPAAFNMVTGPAHWEPLIRIRAVDNQVYMVAASPARDENANYIAYGNSMVVEPWGNIIGKGSEKEEIVYAQIDLDHLEKVRKELPLLRHRRTDVYSII